jgi:hypothetical protein
MDLKTHHDKIINTFNKHIGHERDRASEAGADREEYGKMLELCGLNKKATGWMKALHKMEPDKRDDVLRTFDALRVEMEKNWNGQKTPDMFTGDDEPAAEPVTDNGPSYDADPDFADLPRAADPEIEAEADDFERQLAEVH